MTEVADPIAERLAAHRAAAEARRQREQFNARRGVVENIPRGDAELTVSELMDLARQRPIDEVVGGTEYIDVKERRLDLDLVQDAAKSELSRAAADLPDAWPVYEPVVVREAGESLHDRSRRHAAERQANARRGIAASPVQPWELSES